VSPMPDLHALPHHLCYSLHSPMTPQNLVYFSLVSRLCPWIGNPRRASVCPFSFRAGSSKTAQEVLDKCV
jgi:hypothetical protein